MPRWSLWRGLAGSLSIRVAVLPLLAALPLLAIILHVGREAEHRAAATLGQAALGAARAAAQSQDRAVEHLPALLESLGHLDLISGGDRAACDPALRRAVDGNPLILAAGILSPGGRLLCHSAGVPDTGTLGQAPNFRATLAAGGLFLSGPSISPSTGKAAIIAGLALRGSAAQGGEPHRVVLALLDPMFFPLTIAASLGDGIAKDMGVLVAHRSGVLVGREPPFAQPVSSEALQGILRPGEPVRWVTAYDGIPRVVGLATSERTGLVVGVSFPSDPVLAEASALRNRWLALGASALAGGMALAVVLGEALVRRPIRRLVQAMRLLGHGRYEALRTIEALPGEFRLAAQALLATSAAVRHREEAATSREARLAMEALTDPLTGLANRRSFDRELAERFDRAHASGAQFGLLLVDIDHFKRFNDALGHAAGDAALRDVARALVSARLDATTLVARLGGEEFVLLLDHADAALAIRQAEAIACALRRAAIAHPGQPRLGLTVSIGITVGEARSSPSGEAMLARADRALYQAKASGRNGWRLG